MNIDNNVVLDAAEAQMSASREAQQKPLSPQEETHMSKCVIDRNNCGIVLATLSIAVSYQN